MNNKGTTFLNRIEATLWLLKFIWKYDNVAMIHVLLSNQGFWEHHIAGSNLLTDNRTRVKEIVKSFRTTLERLFWENL